MKLSDIFVIAHLRQLPSLRALAKQASAEFNQSANWTASLTLAMTALITG